MRRPKTSLLALAVVAALVIQIQAATTVFNDAFTEAVTTALASHTPTPTGTSWTEVEDTNGTIVLSAHNADYMTATTGVTSSRIVYTAQPSTALGSADYDVQMTVLQTVTGQSDDDTLFIGCRYASTTSYYGLGIDGNTTAQAYLFERTGTGTSTTIISNSGSKTNITLAANDVFKITCRGDTIRGYQNGVELFCAVDASITAAGEALLGMGVTTTATADVNTLWRGDDYIVSDATGDGGDDNCVTASFVPNGLNLLGVGL